MLRNGRMLGGKSNRGGEAVVWFMDRWVNGGMVQEAMDVVEEDFSEEDAEDDISGNFCWSGQSKVEPM